MVIKKIKSFPDIITNSWLVMLMVTVTVMVLACLKGRDWFQIIVGNLKAFKRWSRVSAYLWERLSIHFKIRLKFTVSRVWIWFWLFHHQCEFQVFKSFSFIWDRCLVLFTVSELCIWFKLDFKRTQDPHCCAVKPALEMVIFLGFFQQKRSFEFGIYLESESVLKPAK